MADNIANNSLIFSLEKILNKGIENNMSRLDNLVSTYESAQKEGTQKYAEVISDNIAEMTDALRTQKEVAQSFYDTMRERYEKAGIAEELNEKTLTDIYQWMVEYAKLQREHESINKDIDKIKSEKRKLPKRNLTQEQADIKSRLDAEMKLKKRFADDLSQEMTRITNKIQEKYTSDTIAGKYINQFKNFEHKRRGVYDAIEAAERANNDRLRRLELAQARRDNEKAIERAKDIWNGVTYVFRNIANEVKKTGTMWLDFNEQAISDAKRLGIVTKEGALAYTDSLLKKTQELSRNFAMSAEEARKMQESYMKVTGRATILTKEQMEDIAAATKLVGKETAMGAIDTMDRMGMTSQTAVELLDTTIARAKNAGLDINKTSEVFVKNLSLANKLNFKDGIDGISRMTILSQKLRMNMDEVVNAAEHFYNIEDAIENAAKIQVLGGAGAIYGSNPMEMLYEANADPEAFQKRIAKMFEGQAVFSRETGQTTIAPFQQAIIREQAKALGISPEEAINLTKRQSEIREIESDLRKYTPQFYNKLSQDQRDSIINKAYYDKETKSFYVNYRDKNGEEQKTKITEVSKLTEAEFKTISEQIEPIDDIRENVRKIAMELIGTRERWKSMGEQWRMGLSRAIHPLMSAVDGVLSWFNSTKFWGWMTTIPAVGVALGLAKAAISGISTALGPGIQRWIINSIANKSSSGEPNVRNATHENNLSRVNGRGNGRGNSRVNGRGNSRVNGRGNGRGNGRVNGRGNGNLGRGSTNSNLMNSRWVRTGGRVLNIAGVAASAYGGITTYIEEDNLAKNKLKDSYDTIKEIENKNGTIIDPNTKRTIRSYSNTEIERMRTQAKNRAAEEESGAVGSGVGFFGGALAGGAIGAKIGAGIGTAILPGVGSGVGALVGGLIGGTIGGFGGGYFGKKYGKEVGRQMASTEGDDIINKHLNAINKGDEEDNIRKIVLPVESIDYNVSLIANQLGVISARPSRGNVYLEAEIEAVKRGEKPIEFGESFLGGNIGTGESNETRNYATNGGSTVVIYTPQNSLSGGYVNQKSVASAGGGETETIISNPTYNYPNVAVDDERNSKIVNSQIQKEVIKESVASNQTPSVNLNLSGSIDLNWRGMNVDKINASDIIKLFESNQEIKNMLAETILNEYIKCGCGGKSLTESSWSARYTVYGLNATQNVGTMS